MLRAASIRIHATGETLVWRPDAIPIRSRGRGYQLSRLQRHGHLGSRLRGSDQRHELWRDTAGLSRRLHDAARRAFGLATSPTTSRPPALSAFTQELRLASHENEKVDWLFGAYYNDEDGLIYQYVHVVEPGTLERYRPFLPGHGTLDSNYKEYAAFANVTIKFTPSFDLTLGGRYSHNDQDVVQNADGPLFGGRSPPSPTATPRKTCSPTRSRRNSSSTIGWRFTRESPRASGRADRT